MPSFRPIKRKKKRKHAATVRIPGQTSRPGPKLPRGDRRGLVAIDPAPCLGDSAFDAIDLVFWRADDLETIAARVEQLAPAVGAVGTRLLDWCAAFAAMVALEIAEASDGVPAQVEPLRALASRT